MKSLETLWNYYPFTDIFNMKGEYSDIFWGKPSHWQILKHSIQTSWHLLTRQGQPSTPDFPDGQVTRSLPCLWCEPEAKATKIHKCYKQPIGMCPKLDILPTSSDYLCRCDIIFQALCETPGGYITVKLDHFTQGSGWPLNKLKPPPTVYSRISTPLLEFFEVSFWDFNQIISNPTMGKLNWKPKKVPWPSTRLLFQASRHGSLALWRIHGNGIFTYMNGWCLW